MSAFFEISGLNIYIQGVVTILSIAIHLLSTRNKKREETVLELVAIYTIGLAGWFSISSGFFGHFIYADEVATGIGWPLNSGFQMELAFAAIGIGLIGGLGFWYKSYWLPFIIAKSTFMWGAALTHIIHMIQNNNFSPSNTGIVVYWDILLPVILIVVYMLYQREQKTTQTASQP
ncbi:MAG: hypothetical protein MUO62_03775 [Anaerolineales bacterium]|nr:hypothetical protein [Anaerolineales bacterium]